LNKIIVYFSAHAMWTSFVGYYIPTHVPMLREKHPTSNHGVHDRHVIKEHPVPSSKTVLIQNSKYVLLFNIFYLSALYVD